MADNAIRNLHDDGDEEVDLTLALEKNGTPRVLRVGY